MIGRLVIVGGTGDLTGRYLLPGLAALEAGGHLPGGFELVGASRDDWSDERYRAWAAAWLERQGADAGAAATVVSAARYHQLDLGDPGDVAACIAGEGPVAVYLARNSALSIRADEAEESWRVVTPVLDGWARDLRPLEEYDPGSQGP